MTKTMKAAVVRKFSSPLEIEGVPIPEPGFGEILVKVIGCGVCHTDLHAADGDWPAKPVPPFIPGHEVAGVVAALGAGVTRFKEGDSVGVAWLYDACMSCEYCRDGLGDAVRKSAQHRLQSQWRVRRVRDRRGALRRTATEGRGLLSGGADSMRGRYHL